MVTGLALSLALKCVPVLLERPVIRDGQWGLLPALHQEFSAVAAPLKDYLDRYVEPLMDWLLELYVGQSPFPTNQAEWDAAKARLGRQF